MKLSINPPNSVINHTLDWTSLGGVSGSTWTVPAGLTQINSSFNSTSTSITVSGGAACSSYELVNYVTGSGGQATSQQLILYFRNF